MAEGVNIWDLAARISVDTAGSDRALTATQQKVLSLAKELQSVDKTAQKSIPAVGKHLVNLEKDAVHAESGAKKLTEAFHVLSSSAVVAEGPMGGVSSRLRALGSEASELGNVLSGASGLSGLLVGATAGIAAFAAIITVGGEALFSLSEKTAKFGDDIWKAHEKTALSVATLSALKIAGAEVGVELSTMTTGLVRFTQNLEKAASGNKHLMDDFKQLNVTAFRDNDKALQQFITSFGRLRTDQERTVAAGEVFGVRFGATLVEVFNRVGGDMGKFEDELRKMGLLMSEGSAEAAHDFMVSLEHIKLVLSGIGRQIGQETMPAFEAFFKVIESSLEANQKDWKRWGDDLAMSILTVESMLGGLANVLNNLSWKNFLPLYGAGKALNDFYQGFKSTADKITTEFVALTSGEARNLGRDMSEGVLPSKRFRIPSEGGRKAVGEDPGKVAERLAALSLKVTLDGIKSEESALEQSLKRREMDYVEYYLRQHVLEDKRHAEVLGGLVGEMKGAEAIKKVGEQQIQVATVLGKKADEETRHKEALAKIEDAILKRTRERIVTMDALIERATRLRRVITGTRDRRVGPEPTDDILDLGGGSIYAPGGGTGEGSTRSRRVGQRAFDEMQSRLHNLADNITSVLSNSIRVGFEQGVGAGLKSMLQGFLDILAQMAEQWLASSIFKMLSGAMDGKSGGGGFWGKLFGILIGAAAGSAGGHGGGYSKMPLPFAHGGIVPGIDRGYDSVPAMLRPGETVVPRGESMGGGHTFIVNINVPTTQAAGSQATMYQVSKQMHGMMAKAALVG